MSTYSTIVSNLSWRVSRFSIAAIGWSVAAVCLSTGGSASAQLPNCTLAFDNSFTCPDVSPPQCGATFIGGSGCNIIGRPSCYDSGSFSFQIAEGQSLMITLAGDLLGLRVFFVHQDDGGSGIMEFFDAADQDVDTPLLTNGPCGGGIKPATQQLFFTQPVRRIEVTNTGTGNVWIDTMEINPACFADTDCDDGDPCTMDTCNGGVCEHQAIPNCGGSNDNTPSDNTGDMGQNTGTNGGAGDGNPPAPAPTPTPTTDGGGTNPNNANGQTSFLTTLLELLCGSGGMMAMPFMLMGWLVLKKRWFVRR